jgi:4-amino-4-deoxy-L-arabinose transferase-like glycosyltransferase
LVSMTGPTIPRKRTWPAPAAILAGAVLVRAAYLVVYARQLPFARYPFGDAGIYLEWARQIAAGAPPGGVFYRAPLYPYVVALLLKASASLWPVYVLQVLLGLGTLLLTYDIARRLFGNAAADIALLLLALTAPLPFFESKLLSATLVLFLVTLGTFFVVLAADRRTRWRWFLAGLAFGLAAIAWPGSLVIFAALCVWALAGRAAGRKSLPVGIFACLAVITVVTARNVVVGEDFVPVSANGGFTFYQGNNRLSAGTLAQPPEVFEFRYEGRYLAGIAEQQEFEQRYAESRLGSNLKPSQVSSFWLRRALTWIVGHPGAYLTLLGRKLVLVLSDYESPSDYSIELESRAAWPLRITFVRFGLLLTLAVVGLLLARKKAAWPVYSVMVGTFAALLLFYVADRYRLPMLPALAVVGGAGLHEAWRRLRFRKLGFVPVIAGAVTLLFSMVVFPTPLKRGSDLLLAGAYRNLGAVWAYRANQPDKAVAALRDAQSIYSKYSATLNPQERLAAEELNELLGAVEPASNTDAALARLQQGDTATAIELLEQGIGRDSTDRAAWLLVGSLYGAGQRHIEAESLFDRAAKRFPDDPVVLFNLAVAAFKARDFRSALAAAERVLELAPGHVQARRIADAARHNLTTEE